MNRDDKSTLRLDESSPSRGPAKITAIRWLCGGADRAQHLLDQSKLVIGRGADVDITLDAAGVSRRHAELSREGPIYALRDLDSTNGTHLNGQLIRHTAISEGDVLRFGDMVGLVVRVPRDDAQPPIEAREITAGVFFGPGLFNHLDQLERVAQSDLPIVITGPTGAGKECIARAVHVLSGRRGPYQAINCAALPAALAESELFGHGKGAFTGADQPALGHFRAARGGTLLLDELADLAPALQAKLLRVLQEGSVTPLGETRSVAVDVRVVAACQQIPSELVAEGRLRADLAARISGMVFEIPPLASRRAEIPLLFSYFLHRHSGGRPPQVEPRLLERLLLYQWPANVRELELLARRLLVLHGATAVLKRDYLPEEMRVDGPGAVSAPPLDQPGVETRNGHDLQRLADELERRGGNLKRAAEAAGISRQRAYRLLGGRTVEELIAEVHRRTSPG